MKNLVPSDLALEGIRIIRENPGVVLVWGVLQLAFNTLSSWWTMSSGMEATNARLQQLSQEINPALNPGVDPAAQQAKSMELLGLYGDLLGAALPVIGLALLMSAVLTPAVYRMVLRPEVRSPGYLRLGADELRQFLVLLATWALLFGVYLGAGIVLVIIGVIVGLVLSMLSPALAVVIITVLLIVGLVGAILYVGVKLSLAGAQSFAERKINIFGSWNLTKSVFWPVLGTYLIAIVLWIVVSVLGFVVAVAPAAILNGGMDGVKEILSPSSSTFAAYFTPARIAYLVVASFVSALAFPIVTAPAAAIYRALTGQGRTSVFS